MGEKALDLFEQMSVDADDVIHAIILKSCAQVANERAITFGKKLLHQICNKSESSNIVLASALYMLMRFDNVKDAENLFESIKNKDMSTYGSMMKAYNFNRQPLKCLKLFQKMKQQDIIPDDTILTLPISACSQLGILAVCHSVVNQIPSDLYGKLSISNALIDMWASINLCK